MVTFAPEPNSYCVMGIVYVLWSWLTFFMPVQQQALHQTKQQSAIVTTSASVGEAKPNKTGIASFYHNKFEGRKTATGEIFDNDNFTAASNFFKLGTFVKVTNLLNGNTVYVKVNDRMGHPSRIIDLTENAARKLRFIARGTTKVKVEQVTAQEAKRAIIAQANSVSNSSNKL